MVTIACGHHHFTDIQAIFFDKDGTLEDSQAFLRQLTEYCLQQVAQDWPELLPVYTQALGYANGQLNPMGLMAVGSRQDNEIALGALIATQGKSWFESLMIARDCLHQADLACQAAPMVSPLFPGTMALITRLWSSSLPLGIISAARTVSVEKFIERHQLSSYFVLGMGADQGFRKPDPRLYRLACERLGVEPRRTLMIGDSEGDMAMAKQAGAKAIAVQHYPGIDHSFLQADVTITHFQEIQIVGLSQ
ncbi:MAG: HAD family hydrolase [Microcystaceae cyanobacterium]